MRSGRVKIPAGESKIIIYVPGGGGPAVRYYRVFSAGKNLDPAKKLTITGAEHGGMPVELALYESIDFGVKSNNIQVQAHATQDAEVVYDFLG